MVEIMVAKRQIMVEIMVDKRQIYAMVDEVNGGNVKVKVKIDETSARRGQAEHGKCRKVKSKGFQQK